MRPKNVYGHKQKYFYLFNTFKHTLRDIEIYLYTYICMYIQTNISTIIFKYNKFLLNINGGRKFVNK